MPHEAPVVSVVIATYNWSNVLRCALQSVLMQTFTRFEVLVVGDGCTDDSEAVVASFGDARLRWANLPENSGSQSASNNRGIELAVGKYIAYLGHDDIWYPTHLESLVRVAEATGADMVGAVAILYGPPGSGLRGVSGVLEGGVFRKCDLLIPSSTMHLRSLSARIGTWRQPLEIELPVDCEFQQRALDAGARIVASGEVSAFKFNAAWRRNSYRIRSSAEQEEMLSRIRTREDFRPTELVAVVRAALEDRFIRVQTPDPARFKKGESHLHNTRIKGAAKAEPEVGWPRLKAMKRFDLADQPGAYEWHEVEWNEEGAYRWSGPSPVATLELPIQCEAFQLRVCISGSLQDNLEEGVRLSINGVPVGHTVESGRGHAVLKTFWEGPAAMFRWPVSVSFQVAETRRPVDNGLSADRRWMGIAVGWLEVTPMVSAKNRESGPVPRRRWFDMRR